MTLFLSVVPAIAGSTDTAAFPFSEDDAENEFPVPSASGQEKETVKTEGTPSIGKWMYQKSGERADWLNIPYRGKRIYEPINIIISDAFAKSPDEAEERLVKACALADYKNRYGHSADYLGLIAGDFRRQFPSKKRHAFSDKLFEEANNHGRVFGPVFYDGKYWFIAAFSREKVGVAPKIVHKFVSFNQARDNFAWLLDLKSDFKVRGFVQLDNALIGSPDVSTGDHDGLAILLSAEK